jgi:hypothetical protein
MQEKKISFFNRSLSFSYFLGPALTMFSGILGYFFAKLLGDR